MYLKRQFSKKRHFFQGIFMVGIWVTVSILMVHFLSAMEPPRRGEIRELKRTRKLQKRLEFIKDIGNHRIDKYLLKKALIKVRRNILRSQGKTRSEIDRMAPIAAPPPGRRGMPTMGSVRTFTLLIDFNDHRHTNTRNFIHDNIYGSGDHLRSPYESLSRYYARSSYNHLDLRSGNTLGWYRTSYNRSAVSQTRQGRENLIKEALNHFNTRGHDFRRYDNDGDGFIDYFIVLWAGPDNGWANFWWGYKTSFSDSTYVLDGVKLGAYSWQWEAMPVGSTFTPIVVIHETGHALGLPDYYDYNGDIGPGGGVGTLDMMDANRGDHNCFSKFVLDWITPTIVARGSYNLNLNASGTSTDAVLIWPHLDTDDMFSEYFMVQNRHRLGNDNAGRIPGDGMLIWHVDARLDSSNNHFLYNNSFSNHKLLRLMEADGLEEIERGIDGADAGDYYRRGRTFNPNSRPSSKKYDETYSGVHVYNFSNPGTRMTATFQVLLCTVSAGSSEDLDRYRRQYSYALPPGKTPDDVVGMAIDGDNNYNFVWFKDGTVSAGSSDDLDRYRRLYRYSLPPGKNPNDIVGMAIDGDNNYNFVWFRDGTVSAGSSDDLDRYRRLYRYSLPPGKSPNDIVGMAIDGDNNYNFVWFK